MKKAFVTGAMVKEWIENVGEKLAFLGYENVTTMMLTDEHSLENASTELKKKRLQALMDCDLVIAYAPTVSDLRQVYDVEYKVAAYLNIPVWGLHQLNEQVAAKVVADQTKEKEDSQKNSGL